MADVVNKIINFYWGSFQLDEHNIDLAPLVEYIDSLDYSDNESGRYFKLSEDSYISCCIDSFTFPIKLRLGRIRKNNLPAYERNGPPEPLELPDGAGLYEPTHMIIFENGIIGSEFNYYGPRTSNLESYLPAINSDIVDNVKIYPVMNRDLMGQISRMGEVKSFDFKVHKDIIALVRDIDDTLHSALAALRELNDQIEEYEIVIKPKKYSRTGFLLPLISRLPQWLSREEVRSGVSKLKVKAYDESLCKDRIFDLMQEFIRSEKVIVRQDSRYRCIDGASMYNAILESYSERRLDIERAIQWDRSQTRF